MTFLRATAVLSVLLLLADPQSGRIDELYQKGVEAHRERDHVTALMNLFAYYQAEYDHLSDEGREKLMQAITDSEAQVRHAVRLRAGIKKIGPVQYVVVRPRSLHGTRDSFGQGRETRAMMPDPPLPKPTLRGKLPKDPEVLRKD